MQGIVTAIAVDRRDHQLPDRRHRGDHRPAGEVLNDATAVPERRGRPTGSSARSAAGFPASTRCVRQPASSAACSSPARSSSLFFVVVAVFAPLIAPYGFNADRRRRQDLRPPSGTVGASTGSAPRVGGEDVLSRVDLRRADRARGDRARRRRSRSSSACRSAWSRATSAAGSTASSCSSPTRCSRSRPLLLAIVVSIAIAGGHSSKTGGILAAAVSITVVYVPQYFRVVRNATVAAREEPYVEAARALGAPPPRDHDALRLRQRRADRAGDRDAQRRRRDPDAGRAGLPRLRHRAVGRLPSGATT